MSIQGESAGSKSTVYESLLCYDGSQKRRTHWVDARGLTGARGLWLGWRLAWKEEHDRCDREKRHRGACLDDKWKQRVQHLRETNEYFHLFINTEMLMVAARTHVDYVGCTSMVFHSSAKVVENDGTREMGSRVQRNEFGDETNQRLVESGTSAKLVSTSVRLVGDDFCMVARQKQIQTGCELSVWKRSVVKCDDRLVTKQFPYSLRQEALPRYEFFDSDERWNVFDECPQEKLDLTRQPWNAVQLSIWVLIFLFGFVCSIFQCFYCFELVCFFHVFEIVDLVVFCNYLLLV